MKSLDRIAASLDASAAGRDHAAAHHRSRSEGQLRQPGQRAERALGFNENEGTTAELIAASAAIEKIIHDDLSWVADDDAALLLMSLLTMRRYEIEYRLTRSRDAEQHFLDEVKTLQRHLFDSVDGPPAMKQKLNKAGADLQLRLRPMGRQHRQHRAAV